MSVANVVDISSHPKFRANKNRHIDECWWEKMAIIEQQLRDSQPISEKVRCACEKREGFVEYLHELSVKNFYRESGFNIRIDSYPEWLAKKMIKEAAPKEGVEQ